jgi:hypothetical protein
VRERLRVEKRRVIRDSSAQTNSVVALLTLGGIGPIPGVLALAQISPKNLSYVMRTGARPISYDSRGGCHFPSAARIVPRNHTSCVSESRRNNILERRPFA